MVKTCSFSVLQLPSLNMSNGNLKFKKLILLLVGRIGAELFWIVSQKRNGIFLSYLMRRCLRLKQWSAN